MFSFGIQIEPDERSKEHNRFSALAVKSRRKLNKSYKIMKAFFHLRSLGKISLSGLRNMKNGTLLIETVSPFSSPRIILLRILDQIVETFLNYVLGI